MRKTLFLLCLLPMVATAQTTKKKVLYMQAVRTNGVTEARLDGTEDFVGPIYNLETKKLLIGGTWRTKNSIKEIRFEIREEEVPDGIEEVTDNQEFSIPPTTYDLSGRIVQEKVTKHGIYIKGGKKIVK